LCVGALRLFRGGVAYSSIPEGASFIQDAMGAIAVGGVSYLSAVFSSVVISCAILIPLVIVKRCELLNEKWIEPLAVAGIISSVVAGGDLWAWKSDANCARFFRKCFTYF
jgi:hypothetical protein